MTGFPLASTLLDDWLLPRLVAASDEGATPVVLGLRLGGALVGADEVGVAVAVGRGGTLIVLLVDRLVYSDGALTASGDPVSPIAARGWYWGNGKSLGSGPPPPADAPEAIADAPATVAVPCESEVRTPLASDRLDGFVGLAAK